MRLQEKGLGGGGGGGGGDGKGVRGMCGGACVIRLCDIVKVEIEPLSSHVYLSAGELQTILCAAFSADGFAYTGTLGGEIYKWEGHTLQSVVKNAHQVKLGYYTSTQRGGRGGRDEDSHY